jgi:hypothetical protein
MNLIQISVEKIDNEFHLEIRKNDEGTTIIDTSDREEVLKLINESL